MFKILTNKQVATFKENEKIYKITIDRRVDNKAHIVLKEIFLEKVGEIVHNKYEQPKTITNKDIQIYTALEEFYPMILTIEIGDEKDEQ